jgi:hypothetical protein
LNGLKKATARTIAYAALHVSPLLHRFLICLDVCMIQARWLLCVVDDWHTKDEHFDRRVFFNVIVDILDKGDPIGNKIVEEFSK